MYLAKPKNVNGGLTDQYCTGVSTINSDDITGSLPNSTTKVDLYLELQPYKRKLKASRCIAVARHHVLELLVIVVLSVSLVN